MSDDVGPTLEDELDRLEDEVARLTAERERIQNEIKRIQDNVDIALDWYRHDMLKEYNKFVERLLLAIKTPCLKTNERPDE